MGGQEPVCSLVSASASQGYVIYPCRDTTKSPQPVIPVIQQRPLCDTRRVRGRSEGRGGVCGSAREGLYFATLVSQE